MNFLCLYTVLNAMAMTTLHSPAVTVTAQGTGDRRSVGVYINVFVCSFSPKVSRQHSGNVLARGKRLHRGLLVAQALP